MAKITYDPGIKSIQSVTDVKLEPGMYIDRNGKLQNTYINHTNQDLKSAIKKFLLITCIVILQILILSSVLFYFKVDQDNINIIVLIASIATMELLHYKYD